MQPTKGLQSDVRPVAQPEGTYPHGKNGIQFDLNGAVINEPGFRKMAAIVPYQFNGIIETDSKPIVFSTDNTYSAIGYFNPETELYEPIVDDAVLPYKLGFNVDNWITGEAQRNYKGEMVCAFTDKFTFAKYCNCDALNVTRLLDWNLFPYFFPPTITTKIEVGGRLAIGTYYAATKYLRSDGTMTAYSPITSGKTIDNEGSAGLTNKALSITITNPDISYDMIIVSIISKIEGKTTAVELDPIPLNKGGSTIVNYTGDNITTAITLEEILTPPAIYSKVGTIGQLNDALYIGELEKIPDIVDMQPYASMIEFRWKSELIDGLNPPEEHISGEKKGLMHEEVYAFYVRYRLSQGGFTKWFVCVGAAPTNPDLATSSIAANAGFSGTLPKKFQLEDTISGLDAGSKSGICGVWINTTETYPNLPQYNAAGIGGEDLRGKPVRHFKMPTLGYCKTNLYATETQYGISKLDILGIQAFNVIIPPQYTDQINGYEIGYAKRTIANTQVYGQSMLLHGVINRYDQSKPTDGKTKIYTSGGNWGSVVWWRGGDNNLEFPALRKDTFRFHAFDMLFNKPGISATHLSGQLKLRKNGKASNGNWLSDIYWEDGPDNGEGPIGLLVDYMDTEHADTPTVPADTDRIRKIKTHRYLSDGVILDGFVNVRHENTFAGTLLGHSWPLANDVLEFKDPGNDNETSIIIGGYEYEETYLTNIVGLKPDVYTSFYSQDVISMGTARPVDSGEIFWGGDIFVSAYTFHTYGRHETGDQYRKGKLVIRRMICESVSNINLRYEVPGNIYSQWWPHNLVEFNAVPNATYMLAFDRSKDPNNFGYTKDLNALNDLVSTTPYSPYLENINKFPYRIHRGGKISRQSKTRSWRSFLPLDYYECKKSIGRITKLQGMDDHLIIHHENALTQTQDKAKLDTGILSVTLGSGDIFQFEPQEVQSAKLGYAGSQHELACIHTPLGYIFVDAKQGELYILKDNKLENLNAGMNLFLRKYLNVAARNPYNGNGITLAWDQKYKRVLISVKNGGNSFTASFSIVGHSWAFYHDYVPDMYFHTREKLWSIKNNRIWKHNDGAPGLYYNEVPQPFFIDIVFNGDSDMLLETITWMTEMVQGNVGISDNDTEWSTLTHITIWNSQQHTGRIALKTVFENLQYEDMRKTQGQWTFNDFRNILIDRNIQFLTSVFNDYLVDPAMVDSNKPWYEAELLEDKYFVVRFEFDNISQKQIILHSINAQVVKSDR